MQRAARHDIRAPASHALLMLECSEAGELDNILAGFDRQGGFCIRQHLLSLAERQDGFGPSLPLNRKPNTLPLVFLVYISRPNLKAYASAERSPNALSSI